MSSEKVKRKLTLSVDEEVIEKAKRLGLNLSEITEAVLRGFAFAPNEIDKASLYDKYKELMDAMFPLIREYGVSVTVAKLIVEEKGFIVAEPEILLCSDGTFYSELTEETLSEIRQIPIYALLEPKEILSNFIKKLASAEEEKKERVEEIEMAKRVILAITESIKTQRVKIAKRELSDPKLKDARSDEVEQDKSKDIGATQK